MKYADKLVDEGFTKEQAESISNALGVLHGSLSRLDFEDFTRFYSIPIAERLADFATTEGVRAVVKDKAKGKEAA